jgi:hypothetical protein
VDAEVWWYRLGEVGGRAVWVSERGSGFEGVQGRGATRVVIIDNRDALEAIVCLETKVLKSWPNLEHLRFSFQSST